MRLSNQPIKFGFSLRSISGRVAPPIPRSFNTHEILDFVSRSRKLKHFALDPINFAPTNFWLGKGHSETEKNMLGRPGFSK